MKSCLMFLAWVQFMISCTTLSKEQRSVVGSFASGTQKIARAPEKIFTELASIRQIRGCYYAASFSDPSLHLDELASLAKESADDARFPDKVAVSFRLLDKYAQLLEAFAANKTATSNHTLFVKAGKDLETLVADYNKTTGGKALPSGIGTLTSRLADDLSTFYRARRTGKLVRQYSLEADTLVALTCLDLKKMLSDEGVGKLILQEESGLRESFHFYFAKAPGISVRDDVTYVRLLKRIALTKELQLQAIRAVGQLRTSHAKLVKRLQQRPSAGEVYEAAKDFLKESDELASIWNKIDKQL
ncbi:MAG: hypothetical protein LWW85_04005 [Marinilabiliales bacterium]|nr:hypothetical protein [Marinilabiliales bacterium]